MTTTAPVLLAQMQGAWHDGGMPFGMHWGWWFFWILVLLVFGGAMWRFSTRSSGTRDQTPRGEGAEEALRKRFASGEISDEEFTARLRVLREARDSD